MTTKIKHVASNAITTAELDTSSLDSHFSGGTGVTYSGGAISIGQAVHSTDSPTFADLTITGNLNITGNIDQYNVTDLDVTDKTITLGSGQIEANSGGSGIIIDGSGASILWDEANTEWDFNSRINVLSAFSQYYSIRESGTQYGFIGQYKVITGTGSDTSLTIFSETGDGINFAVNGSATKAVVIAADGNVGIGTSDPSTSKLRVYNSTVTGNTRLHVHNDKNGDAAELRLEGKRTSNNDTGQLLYVNSGNVVARISANSSADDGDLRFYTSATGTGQNVVEAMRIDSTGNVGIGTIDPDTLLELRKDTASSGYGDYPTLSLRNDNAAGYSAIHFQEGSTQRARVEVGNNSGTPYMGLYTTSGASGITIKGGNVGIGTSSPDTLLHLSNNGTTPATIRIERNDTTISDTNIYGGIEFEGQDGSAGSAAGIRGKILGVAEGATGEMALTFETAGGYGSSTERMRIDSSGNVGIGITPAGYETYGYALRLDGGTQTYISFNNNTHTTQVLGGFVIGNDSGAARITQRENQPIIFSTNDNTAMTITADGAISMGDRAANIPQINIGTQGKASGMEFYPYSSVGTTYSAWDLNLGANISPKLGTTSSGHQIMTSYTASGGSNLRVGFNQLAWQRWTPAELNGKAAHDSVTDKGTDPMFQVTTDGHMRAPYSSAFRTYLSTERTTNGLINSGWTDTSSSGVNAYDRAGDFNTSNGRFTAPVDGVYHFDVMWDSNASQAGLNLHVTGTGHTEYNVKWEPTGRSDDVWESKAYSTSVQMDTGDYVELYAIHCTGTNPVHMGSGHWGFFAGHLVS